MAYVAQLRPLSHPLRCNPGICNYINSMMIPLGQALLNVDRWIQVEVALRHVNFGRRVCLLGSKRSGRHRRVTNALAPGGDAFAQSREREATGGEGRGGGNVFLVCAFPGTLE